jgi:hypothetical protein
MFKEISNTIDIHNNNSQRFSPTIANNANLKPNTNTAVPLTTSQNFISQKINTEHSPIS